MEGTVRLMLFFSSPESRRQSWFASTTLVILGCAAILLGISTLRVGFSWESMTIPVGLFLLSGGLVMYSWNLVKRRAITATNTLGTSQIKIWRNYLHGALTLNSGILVICLWGLVTALVLGSTWWPWLLTVVLGLYLVWRVFRSIRDQPVLALSPDGISYRGPGIDRYLAWEDVYGVDVAEGRFGRVIRVAGNPTAPSYRHSDRYRVPPYESKVPPRTMEVSVQGPREEDLINILLPTIRAYLERSATRTEIGTSAFLDRLARPRFDR